MTTRGQGLAASPLGEVDLWSEPLEGPAFHRLMDQAREAGPIVPARFAGQPAFLITRFAELHEYFSRQDEFPGGEFYRHGLEPVIGRSFISIDGHDHDVYRQLATPAFRSRAVQRFVDDQVRTLADEVIDRFVERGEGDLAIEIAQILPFWAISRKLGLPLGTEEAQRSWALSMLSYPGDPEGAMKAVVEVTEFLLPVIHQRQHAPGEDVISELLSANYHGVTLTEDEICSHVRLLYSVGATTTSDAMSSMLRTLLVEPGLLDRLRSDQAARSRMIQEVLRLEPAVPVMPRMAANGGSFAGCELPPGAIVLCGIAAANRDPQVFSEPDAFDLERTETELITFGFGTKYCPGSHLARRQLEATLDAVLDRLPGLRLIEASQPVNAILRRVEHVVASWDLVGGR